MHGLYASSNGTKYSESITITDTNCFIRLLLKLFINNMSTFKPFLPKRCKDYASCVAKTCKGSPHPDVYVATLISMD